MYINLMTDENKNIYLSYWRLLITGLVSLMIVVGGLTRLTDSGLSITRWDLISGILPPLSLDAWNKSFSLYKMIPEFKLLNSTMSLEEFKVIFWWEYIHRLLGRIIGLFYIIPLIFFTFAGNEKLNKSTSFYLIFLLICFQGFIGWYMVKSGLTERTDVSHYRLSLHLIVAFIILISLIWNYLDLNTKKTFFSRKRIPYQLPLIFIFLVLLQIIFGAFVSGLDAGQIYQTWPLMNQGYFPDDSTYIDLLSFSNPSIVQFIHRNLAYLIILVSLLILFTLLKNNIYSHLRKSFVWVFIFLSIQIVLGIFAILSGATIIIASLHQIGSIFLVISSISFVYKNYKT